MLHTSKEHMQGYAETGKIGNVDEAWKRSTENKRTFWPIVKKLEEMKKVNKKYKKVGSIKWLQIDRRYLKSRGFV